MRRVATVLSVASVLMVAAAMLALPMGCTTTSKNPTATPYPTYTPVPPPPTYTVPPTATATSTSVPLKRIVFSSNRSGSYQLWSIYPNGSGLTQLTSFSGAQFVVGRWSLDGSRIVCEVGYTGNCNGGNGQLWVMYANGTGACQLTSASSPSECYPPAISLTANRVAYSNQTTCGENISTIIPNFPGCAGGGSGNTLFTGMTGPIRSWPDFQPATDRILYRQLTCAQQPQLYRVDLNGNNNMSLTAGGSSNNGDHPRWSRDGAQIVFAAYNGGFENIWTMDATGGSKLQRTFGTTYNHFYPCFDPTSSLMAFTSDQTGSPDIYTRTVSGGTPTNLTNDSYSDTHPDWEP